MKREFPFIHFGGQKGYEEAGNQAVGKLVTIDMFGTEGLLVSGRVRCLWNFLLVLTCTLLDILYEIRCVAMGTLSIHKPCQQLAIPRLKMRTL